MSRNKRYLTDEFSVQALIWPWTNFSLGFGVKKNCRGNFWRFLLNFSSITLWGIPQEIEWYTGFFSVNDDKAFFTINVCFGASIFFTLAQLFLIFWQVYPRPESFQIFQLTLYAEDKRRLREPDLFQRRDSNTIQYVNNSGLVAHTQRSLSESRCIR